MNKFSFLLLWALCGQCEIPHYIKDAFYPVLANNCAAFKEKCLYGSAFLVDAKRGLLMTNAHVVFTGLVNRISVFNKDGKMCKAKVVLEDSASDLAVIQVDPQLTKNQRPLGIVTQVHKRDKICSFDMCKKNADHSNRVPCIYSGQKILSISNDADQPLTISEGTLMDVQQSHQTFPGVWQHTYTALLDVQHGASGSPVLNADYDLVGVFVGIFNYWRVLVPSYYAANLLKKAQDLVDGKDVQKKQNVLLGYGFASCDVHLWPTCMRDHPQLQDARRMLVLMRVDKCAPCHDVQTGDVLLSVNGQAVNGDNTVLSAEVEKSDNLDCVFLRRNELRNVRLPVTKSDDELRYAQAWGKRLFVASQGVRSLLGMAEAPGAPLDLGGFAGSLRIFTLGGRDLHSMDDLKDALRKVGWGPTTITQDMGRWCHGRERMLHDTEWGKEYQHAEELTIGEDGFVHARVVDYTSTKGSES